MKSRVLSAVCLTGFILTSLCLGGMALAQSTNSGEIRGTVTDASGAVVPDVKVTVLNVDTGVSKEYTTNDAGLYDTGSILPGNYKVTFNKAGFSALVRAGVDLHVGAPITVNGQLAVGTASTSVEVAAETPLLKTETGEQSTHLVEASLKELPQVGRDWSNLTKTLPGAVGSGIGVSVNGIMPFEANWLSDGGASINPHSANVNQAMFESIAEVQIETSSYSAEYGTGSVVFNQISKSGSNQWHGSLYEFLQNDFLNSRSFFSPAVGNRRYNNFGGSVSGPIIKNKAFFFFNVDKTINNSSSYGFHTVPTSDMKAGDFSNPAFTTIYDPLTFANGTRTPFAANQIPTNRMDPVSLAVQKFFPGTTLPGYVNNNQSPTTGKNPFMKYFGRADYQIKSSNRLTLSVTKQDNPTVNPNFDVIDTYIGDIDSYNGQVSDVWTFTPTLINEARVSYHREFDVYTQNALGAGFPQQLGWKFQKADMFPGVNIGGTVGGTSIGTTNNNAIYAQNTFSPSDTVTWIHGKHILHFGGEVLIFKDNDTPWGNVAPGTMTFSGVYTTAAPNAARNYGYADFLLGYASSYGSTNSPINGMRETQPQFYVQDDFKVLPNLTVNLGVRYQIMTGWREKHNQLGAFDPTITNPATNTLGAMWFSPANGRNQVQATVKNIVLPRVSFAWSAGKHVVLRGGFGMFTQPWSEDYYAGGAEGLGASISCNVSDTTQLAPVLRFSDASPFLNCNPASKVASGYNNQGVNYFPYDTPAARVYQWSFSLQRELGRGMVAEAAYIGNHAANMPFLGVEINQVPGNLLAQSIANTSQAQNLRPYPQFRNISGGRYNAISNYNSLQLSLKKRFARGLTFDTNYTWSKMMSEGDSSGWSGNGGPTPVQNANNPGVNYARSNLNRTHLYKANGVYQLPIGKGKTLLNQGGPLDWVAGGWQVSAILQYQSGQWYTPTMNGANNSGALSGSWFPNVVGDPVLSNPTIQQWFNPAAFATPTSGTWGNAGRNILEGPSLFGLDFSMAKSFAVPRLERGRLQLRMDTTNILNHTSFSNPNAAIGNAAVGRITGTTVSGRTLQLGARLSF